MRLPDFKHALQMFWVYVGCSVADIISSLHIKAPFEETNPFSRHADGTFWLKHALVCDGIHTLEILFLSAAVYLAARPLGTRVARVAMGLPWLYYGYLHLDAAFNNALLQTPHLYVETAHGLLGRLLGY
jgi:hypothetical protein